MLICFRRVLVVSEGRKMSPNRRIFLNIVATYGRSVYRYWRGCGNLLRKKSGAVAQGGCGVWSNELQEERCAPFCREVLTSQERRAHIGKLSISDGVGRGVFSVWKWYNMRHSIVQVFTPSWRAGLLFPTSTSTLNFDWKNMGEKTQKDLLMGYSAAYPTGAERIAIRKEIV